MIRALWIKEWRQLAGLRWVGLGLGLGMPLLLGAVAEAARRGWIPFGRISSFTMREILGDAVPVGLVGLWGLLALLVAAQTFTGDRSAGTERFLLERPVPRARIWAVRLAAIAATVLVLATAHLGFWAALAQIVVGLPSHELLQRMGGVALFGGLFALTGLVGGVVGSSFVASPIQALLSGGLLAAAPALFSVGMSDLFPMVLIGTFPVAGLFAWLLLPVYLVASWAMECRGEPAGRGRWLRGLAVLAIGTALVPVTFVAGAGVLLRPLPVDAPYAWHVAPDARTALAVYPADFRSARISWLSVTDGRELRYFPAPVTDVEWSADGRRLMVVHQAGPLGSVRDRILVDLYDAEDGRLLRRIELDEQVVEVQRAAWIGDRPMIVLAGLGDGSRQEIRHYRDEGAEAPSVIAFEARLGYWKLVGPTRSGQMVLIRTIPGDPPRYTVQRVDVPRGTIDELPVASYEAKRVRGERLSPDGRAVLFDQDHEPGRPGSSVGVLDLETGAATVHPEWSHAVPLADGRMLVLTSPDEGPDRTRLLQVMPDGTTTEVHSWRNRSTVLRSDSRGERVLTVAWKVEADGPRGPYRLLGREVGLFRADTGTWSDVFGASRPTPCADRMTSWDFAGDDALSVLAPRGAGIVPIDGVGPVRWLVGKGCADAGL